VELSAVKKINSICQHISVFGPLSCMYIVHSHRIKNQRLEALQSVDSCRASKGCCSYGSDQVFPPYFPKYTSEVAIQWEQSWCSCPHTENPVFPTIQIPDDTPNLNTGHTSHSFSKYAARGKTLYI